MAEQITLYNTREAAEVLHITPRRLREWIKVKHGPVAFKSGSQYLFWRVDVMRYLGEMSAAAREEYERAGGNHAR